MTVSIRACLVAGVLAMLAARPAGPAKASEVELPFTSIDSGAGRMKVRVERDGTAVTLEQATSSWQLPIGVVPQQALALGRDRLLLARQALAGNWRAFRLDTGGHVAELAVDPELGRRLLLMHGFRAGNDLFAVAYDVEGTIAAGRSGSVVRDGMDLYRVDVIDSRLSLTQVIDKSALGGLDNAFRDMAIPDGHLVCGQSGCWRLRMRDGVMSADEAMVMPKGWAGFVQIELFMRDGEARALLRRDDDDRFTQPPVAGSVTYRDCPVLRDDGCIDLPPDRLPSGVTARGEISYVEACADVSAMLERDLTRLPNGGLTFWAMNNHEGRIPWGQVYVLDGMLDVAEGKVLKSAAFDGLRDAMLRRVALEVASWGRLADTESPWLWSRRYSIERRDIVSVVHLGRMARLAARLLALQPDLKAPLDPLLHALRRELGSFERTIEVAGERQLRVKRGADFWLDGGNAAWNIQNAWIEGVAALDRLGPGLTASRPLAGSLVEDFIATEIAPLRPDIWQYCAGRCQEGWMAAESISVNKPDWEGNKTRTSTAHASYRAMDARAVLEAMRLWNLPGLAWFPDYVRGLVERGWLYPMVGAPLSEHGITPVLHPALVGRYGRAAIPFDIHNQIWALDQIARSLGCTARR